MSNFRNLELLTNNITFDASGRMRTSELSTLHDGKIVNGHASLLFETAGTGTHTPSNSKHLMEVTAGQYCIYSSRRFFLYLAGKSEVVEETFDLFAPQADVRKRFGYFFGSTVAPHDANPDGFWCESSNGTISIKCFHEDYVTAVHDKDITEWTGYADLGEYQNLANWDNFTVAYWDFLWLGGANLRLFVMTQNGFVLAHQFIHAGMTQDTMMKTPCKPVRFDISSTTGVGSYRYICSQVATEGDTKDSGLIRSVEAENISLSTIGVLYPVLAIDKDMAYRCVPVSVEDVAVYCHSNNDRARFYLLINPTLSAPLSYSAVPNSSVRVAVGDGIITATIGTGTRIASGTVSSGDILPSGVLDTNFLSFMGQTLAGVSDQYVLCVKPQTANVTLNADLYFKEF